MCIWNHRSLKYTENLQNMRVAGRHSEVQIKQELEGTTGETENKETKSRSNSCKVKQNMWETNKGVESLTNQTIEGISKLHLIQVIINQKQCKSKHLVKNLKLFCWWLWLSEFSCSQEQLWIIACRDVYEIFYSFSTE